MNMTMLVYFEFECSGRVLCDVSRGECLPVGGSDKPRLPGPRELLWICQVEPQCRLRSVVNLNPFTCASAVSLL